MVEFAGRGDCLAIVRIPIIFPRFFLTTGQRAWKLKPNCAEPQAPLVGVMFPASRQFAVDSRAQHRLRPTSSSLRVFTRPRPHDVCAPVGLVFCLSSLRSLVMTFSSRRVSSKSFSHQHRRRLFLTSLEDRCNPVNVANTLVNAPTADTIYPNHDTQNETSTIVFGSGT